MGQNSRTRLSGFGLGIVGLACALVACSDHSVADSATGAEDLTSNSGSLRTLTFQGLFYVPTGTSDSNIAARAQLQAKAVFGALRTSDMAAGSRYMSGIVAGSIKRLPVNVLDTATAGAKGTAAVRVTYQYKDTIVVPKNMTSSTFATALLNPAYDTMQGPIRAHCTPGETENGEPIWYSYDTSGAACQADISAEDAAIAQDRTHLPPPGHYKYPWITLTELHRVFFPTVFQIGPDTTNTAVSYPEYDRLYSGNGVESGKMVLSLVAGYVTHKAKPSEAPLQGKFVDTNGGLTLDGWVFEKFASAIGIATSPRAFTVTSAPSTQFTVNGHTYSWPNVLKVLAFANSSSSSPPTTTATADEQAADYDALMQAIMDRVSKTWLRFEAPVTVSQGGQSHPLTLALTAYFGTDEEDTPVFKTAFKKSDVLTYMGHSYTGHGPYAPNKMVAADFPSTYQLMFFNGCVSYNYYNQAFFKLKPGGTKVLDTITNSIEGQFSDQEGTFAAALFDGSLPSYTELLTRLQDSAPIYGSGDDAAYDPFRVVDGELDNTYSKAGSPITVQ